MAKKIVHILSDVFFSGAENMVCQIMDMFRGEYDMVYVSPDGPCHTPPGTYP